MSAEHPAWSASSLTVAQRGPCTHRETKVLGSRTTRSGSHPVKAKALRGTMAPPNGPPGFVPKGL